MADPKIKFKRSAVAGKIPTATQVPLGELALNTNDGLLYASKDVGAGVTVIAVNPFRVGTGTDSYNTFFTAGNVGINSTIPTSKLDVDGDVKLSGVITATTFSGSGASLTNLPAANITGTLPAISGANLTNLNGSNISSGTVAAARVGALPAGKVTSGTFDAARIPTLNQDTTGTAALAEGLTGSPNITVSDVNVGGGLSVTGNSFFVGVVTFAAGTDGNIVLGDAATDNVVFNADVNSNIVPNTNNAYDLGSSSQKWRNLFISGNANIGGTLTYEDVTNIDSVGLVTARSGIAIPDNQKIQLGAGNDLQIYHDGSHSYIDDAGTGNLRLRSGTLEILNLAGSKKSAVFNSGSGQELYFDNSKKFETVTGGVTVTGTASATLFSGSGASLTNLPAANLTGTLPAISGANLTNLDASDLASGTIPDARFPAALPAIDGSALTGITASGTGAIGGLTIKNQSGAVVGTAGSVSTIDFDGSAGVTVTATTGAAGIATVLISADLVTDTSPQLGGNLDLNGNNITGSGDIPAANLTGTLPAISGANLTNLNGSNISSGTVAAARVGALPASKITTGTFADARIPNLAASKVTSGTFDAARIPTLNQDTTGTAALAEGLTGSPTIGVSTITTTGSVGIGSTQPTGKLDVLGQVNIKGSSTTTTSGIATSYTGSVEFDGTGDYLQISSNSDLSSGTGDFTFEAWVRSDVGTQNSSQCIYDNRSGTGSNTTGFFLGRMSAHSGKVELYSAGNYRNANGTAFTEGQWNHVAVVRHSNVIKLYLNGTKSGDDYNVTDDYSNTTARIGAAVNGTSTFYGEISNARFVKGTALYKSNFTPQTAELTQVYNTTLLACQSSSSATAEATGKTITANGNAAASTTNPSLEKGFDLSGSVAFDGTGDYLEVTGNSNLDLGTGNFTIEGFFNTSKTTNGTIIGSKYYYTNGYNGNWVLRITNSTQMAFASYNGRSSEEYSEFTVSYSTNRWHHFALVREGTGSNQTKLYIDGTLAGSMTVSKSLSDGSNGLGIGDDLGGTNSEFQGNLSNIRIIKGTALYTSNFSPTFTELTNLPNTKLLALQSSSSATAYAVSPGVITAYGDAAASSTSPGLISPNSLTGSVQFDGTTDYMDVAASSEFAFGTGDFTIECFINSSVNSADTFYRRIYMTDGPTGNASGNLQIAIEAGTGKVNLWEASGALNLLGTSNVTNSKWNHIAVVRSGNTLKIYVNGIQEASTTYTTSVTANSGSPRPRIGNYDASTGRGDFNGYISNLRVVKGTALYTAAFTPSREELTDVTNTSLLALQSSSSATAEATGKTITANGNAAASTTSPGLVKAYTNASGQTTTTTTTPGNLLVSGITTATNRIDIKSDDSTPGRIDFYCESSNAHYTQLRSAVHASYSGIATVILPTSSGTLLLSDGSGASLTNLPAANLTGTLPAISGANLTNLDASDLASGTIPDARFPATLPAASGANLTNLDASDLASGTIPDARFPATLPAISGANLTNISASIAGISTAGTSTFNHLNVSGVSTFSSTVNVKNLTGPDAIKVFGTETTEVFVHANGDRIGDFNSDSGAQSDEVFSLVQGGNAADVEVASSRLKVKRTGGNVTAAFKTFTTIVGTTYTVTCDVEGIFNSGNPRVQVTDATDGGTAYTGTQLGVGNGNTNTRTSISFTFTATSTTSSLNLGISDYTREFYVYDLSITAPLEASKITLSSNGNASVAGIATVSTAFYLPQYTTTARDAGTFNEGAMIYNTTLKKMEFYDGTNWVTLPGVTLGLGMGVF